MEEPQKLAEFLRTRCVKGMYGLRFLNQEQTLIYIPWPNAPKPNEELPHEFGMFKEWAILSFRKRGSSSVLAQTKEAPTCQKHRFRNALQRANGLESRNDIHQEGGKVFELVETPRKRNSSAGSSNLTSYTYSPSLNGYTASPGSISSTNSPINNQSALNSYSDSPVNNNYSYYTISPRNHDFLTTNHETLNKRNEEATITEMNPGDISSSSPICNDLQTSQYIGDVTNDDVNILQTSYTNTQHQPLSDYSVVDDEFLNELMNGVVQTSPDPQNLPFVNQMSEPAMEPLIGQSRVNDVTNDMQTADHIPNQPLDTYPNECQLSVKVRFRNLEAASSPQMNVTNTSGCRIFSGNNVHDISSLLEPDHLTQITESCRRNPDELFGPGCLQQIRLPDPGSLMRSKVQLQKTSTILSNMERGMILWMEWKDSRFFRGIPDVMALRLCQTRIFPFNKKSSPINCFPRSLTRLQSIRVFSAEIFCQQLDQCIRDQSQQFPTPSISFALGQKVAEQVDDLNNVIVSMSVTVERARFVLDSVLDRDGVCISDMNSSDHEARWLAKAFVNSIRLDSL